MAILYKVDAGTESTYNWTGSLASGATASVTLPSITYTAGSHTFTARTNVPNGATDGNIANDAITSNFTFTSCSNLNEPADNSATTATVMAVNTSISSQIGTTTDVDYFKFTTTSAAPKIKITLTNLPADYDLYLHAARTNGTINTTVLKSSSSSGTTSETIIHNTPTAAATYYIRVKGFNGALSTSVCYNLTLSTNATGFIRPFEATADLGKEGLEKTTMLIYPNPASDILNIQFNANEESDYRVSLDRCSWKRSPLSS